MKEYQGELVAPAGAKFALVVGRFNEFITRKLLDGAVDTLTRHGADADDIEVFWTPGAFEIPVLTQRLAATGRYDAVVCLGAVIRGGTDHHLYVAAEVTKGVASAAMATGVPCLLGVLTCDTIEQAIERAGTKAGNKGADSANAAIEMVNLLQHIPGSDA